MVRVALAPTPSFLPTAPLVSAIESAGGVIAPLAEAEALVWTDPKDHAALRASLAEGANLRWVQLPFAGIESFTMAGVLDPRLTWTCGKGVYAVPVAEHALALTLALLRRLPERAVATSWGERFSRSLAEEHVCILGGGGIAEVLVGLLAPMDTQITVVRRTPTPMPGAARTVALADLDEALAHASVVIVAWALTPQTHGLLDERRLALIGPDGVLVNVARGAHVVTDDLVRVLTDGRLGAAGLDVTDPEPLPDGHPLWTLPNALITPHCADAGIGQRLLARRVAENVRRWRAGEPLLGLVDIGAGY